MQVAEIVNKSNNITSFPLILGVVAFWYVGATKPMHDYVSTGLFVDTPVYAMKVLSPSTNSCAYNY